MLDENLNIKLIDFGEAKYVDKFEQIDAASAISKANSSSMNKASNNDTGGLSSQGSYFSKYLPKVNAYENV